jgi:lysophospholipase L1-like esterase
MRAPRKRDVPCARQVLPLALAIVAAITAHCGDRGDHGSPEPSAEAGAGAGAGGSATDGSPPSTADAASSSASSASSSGAGGSGATDAQPADAAPAALGGGDASGIVDGRAGAADAGGEGAAGRDASGARDGAGGSDAGRATTADAAVSPSWVGTWATGPQLTEMANLPPAPGLTGNTLRQIVYTSVGGNRLRVRLSNAYGDGPVTLTSVHLAVSQGAGAIDPTTDTALSFGGAPSVTIPTGGVLDSDAFTFSLAPRATLAITIVFGNTPAAVTGHPGSRTTSYLVSGNAATAMSMPGAATTAHWYFVTGVDVLANTNAQSGAIVALGDSITDGRGSTTDGNDRWPDDLSRRLRASAAVADVAVLNEGIGGNAVLSGGLGPTAVQRFSSDVLGQSGARWLVLLEGVNDIGASTQDLSAALIAAFGQFIDMAHGAGMRVYGIPILPFGVSMYASDAHEASRQTVNTWIRTSGRFDAVIDLDSAVRDPATPENLLPAFDSGDHLHLNPAGYQKMADTIDLTLFSN